MGTLQRFSAGMREASLLSDTSHKSYYHRPDTVNSENHHQHTSK